MQEGSEVYVGLDTSKLKISVALAAAGREGEVRFLGVSCPRFLWTPICPRGDRNDEVQHEQNRSS
jgi:hypothetical protein